MSLNILRLAPLKEENFSEDEDDHNDKRKISPFQGRRHSIKDSSVPNELNLNISNTKENIKRSSKFKSPKKSRKTAKLISQKIILNKNNFPKVDLCLYALEMQPNKRGQELTNYIKTYLKSMPSFMNIISKEKNLALSENLIEQISKHLRHEFIPKNNFVCRFGERGEKFYIILKGKVSFLVPKMMKCYLNFEEYITYLMQLRKNEEFEILQNLLVQNRIIYPIDDDDLDRFLLNEYDKYQRNLRKTIRKKTRARTIRYNTNINNLRRNSQNSNIIKNDSNENTSNRASIELDLQKNNVQIRSNIRKITVKYNQSEDIQENDEQKSNLFSPQTYQKMGFIIDKIRQMKCNSSFNRNQNNKYYFSGEMSPKIYLKSNNVQDRELGPKNRKLVNIYHYEDMNTFESGQTFGFIALVSKTCKRASTVIVIEDCDLGVLTKEEYLKFFEEISSKEKKNLYELLKFYNLITMVSEHKFIKRYYHLFEYKKVYKGHNILEQGKTFNELLVFSQGLFNIYINANIPEINELITKIKIIRGKLLGLPKNKIEENLEEKRENEDMILRKNYLTNKEKKILFKKYNYTISIISDHLILGYADTVDPKTNMPLFNCSCTSAECEGYSITNKSLSLANKDSIVIHKLTEFCLKKIEYNLARLKHFKKEILTKLKESEIAPLQENKMSADNIIEKIMENKKNNNDFNNKSNNNKNNLSQNEFSYMDRNKLIIFRNSNNNNKKLLTNQLNQDTIEKAKNIINSKNEESKNILLDKGFKKSIKNSLSRNKLAISVQLNSEVIQKEKSKIFTIPKLRENTKNEQNIISLNFEDKISQIIQKNFYTSNSNVIKHSLSTEFPNNTGSIVSKKNKNNKGIRNLKFNGINIFNNYMKDINHINYINNLNKKMLSPLMTKNNLQILPKLKIYKKKLNKSSDIKQEIGINKDKKKYERNATEELFRIEQFSFVKEKYIKFKSKDKYNFSTLNYDTLPKINIKNKNYHFKMKKLFLNNLSNDMENKEDNKLNENTDNKNNFETKLPLKENIKEKNNNTRYNELNNLVNNMQKITNEILSKKV